MQNYSLFHPIIWSFFSRELYKDVKENWSGIGGLYLMLLLFVAWAPWFFHTKINIDQFQPYYTRNISGQVPDFAIEDGKISINKPVPYSVQDYSNQQPLMVIDTSGQINTLSEAKAPILMTQNKIVSNLNGSLHTLDFSNFKSTVKLSKREIDNYVNGAFWWLVLIIFPFLLVLSFAYRLVISMLLASLGKIFAGAIGVNCTYQDCLRVMIVAFTPMIVFGMLLSIFNITLNISWFLYLGIECLVTLGFFIFGISACKDE